MACEGSARTQVIKAHHATDDQQLELALGDIVIVLEKDPTGWWGGYKEGEDKTAWFPASCVQECEVEPDTEPSCFANESFASERYVLALAPETEQRSPLRGSRAVASPQRGKLEFTPAPSSMEPEMLDAVRQEEVELRRKLQEKEAELQKWKRQSVEADRSREDAEKMLEVQSQQMEALRRRAKEEEDARRHMEAEYKRHLQLTGERKAAEKVQQQEIEALRRRVEEEHDARRHLEAEYKRELQRANEHKAALDLESRKVKALEDQIRVQPASAAASVPTQEAPRPVLASPSETRGENPPRGYVAETAKLFEQRCQTPRRESCDLRVSRSEPREHHYNPALRFPTSARQVPPLPKSSAAQTGPALLPSQASWREGHVDEIDINYGMTPIRSKK